MPKPAPFSVAEEQFNALSRPRNDLANAIIVLEYLRKNQDRIAARAVLAEAEYDVMNLLGEYGVAMEDYRATCAKISR